MEKGKVPVVAGAAYDVIEQIAAQVKVPPMTQPVKLVKLEGERMIKRVLGAASAQLASLGTVANPTKLREMTDPYTASTRKDFATCALEDPTFAPSLKKRNTAFFKNGFHLELRLKSMRGENGESLTPEQAQQRLDEEKANYDKYVQQLEDWMEEDNIKVNDKMHAANISSIVQGRSLTLIFPSISALPPGQLPISLKTISYEDITNPIVNTDFWNIVGVRLANLGRITVALPDEMVYIPRNDWGLRKFSAFYGASDIEPILQASKIYRKIVNYDFAKAAVAAYVTKLLLAVPTEGLSKAERENVIGDIITKLTASGTDVLGVETGTEVTPVPVKVDTQMLDMLATRLENLLRGVGGATKTQMGVTEGLTRDNATIQEQAFIRYIRDPDEEIIKTHFENQLFNPLLAHLAGKDFEEIPVRVMIIRDEPSTDQEESVDADGDGIPDKEEIQDNNSKQKAQDLNKAENPKVTDEQALKQNDAGNNTLGA